MKADRTAYMTIQGVADRYGVTYLTARDWARQGRIPAFQIGGKGRWFVRRDKLEASELGPMGAE